MKKLLFVLAYLTSLTSFSGENIVSDALVNKAIKNVEVFGLNCSHKDSKESISCKVYADSCTWTKVYSCTDNEGIPRATIEQINFATQHGNYSGPNELKEVRTILH